MKLKFDPSLEHQLDAIEAVVRAFEGHPFAHAGASEFYSSKSDGLFQSELGIGNLLLLSDEDILKNVRAVQQENDIEQVSALQGRDFSIEMETGTGKTYVYLRTIFEINKRYGFKKFVVVVPSVAIREGVLKSVDVTREHFRGLYDNTPFDCFVYDSSRLGKVRQFSNSSQIQIMVINIQSFQKDMAEKSLSEMTETEIGKLNIINRENDRMSGRRPIEFIQAANPIVIIDEPQSVDSTEKSRRAIGNLNPLFTLRYSATHRNSRNLLYRLDPVRAYDLRLVKRIEVASVREENSFNDAYVKLLKTDNAKGIKALLEIHKQGSDGPAVSRVWVRRGDDLYLKSGEREIYRDGFIVRNIDSTPGSESLEFNQGRFLEPGQETGGSGDDLMRVQIRETVEQHLKKERALRGKGVKVLSLFFVDRVANYRVHHDDGTTSLGKFGLWFEQEFRELAAKPAYRDLLPFEPGDVHDGYFSRDRGGRSKDTRGNTVADEDTYNLIMRDKERLLDPATPLRFIFSHSALREGWDNPNVFQICTLNETRSFERKRQEIGRGLRLPVNGDGERVHDETVNRLTVVANESYEEFARTLQTEFEDDLGIQFGKVDRTAFSKLVGTDADGRLVELGQELSMKLWSQLVDGGYLGAGGEILSAFDPGNPGFDLAVSEEFASLKPEIADLISRRHFRNRIADARERRRLEFRKEVFLDDDFRELWDRIKHRTRYRVRFDSADIVERSLERIRMINPIEAPHVSTTVVAVDISDAGISAERRIATSVHDVAANVVLPDILGFLQKETELTRRTLAEILKRSGRLDEFRVNPQAFMTAIAKQISQALHDQILDGIRYDKVHGQHWEMSRIEKEAEKGIIRYLSNLYQVRNREKTLFDSIELDSEVERKFAFDLDNNENVRLFVKLPGWFRIDTPVGPYNPDWAFVAEREEKLYFVRETKGVSVSAELREKENRKIACGRKHFDALGVDFDVVTSLEEAGF